jgi:hypothetical protein
MAAVAPWDRHEGAYSNWPKAELPVPIAIGDRPPFAKVESKSLFRPGGEDEARYGKILDRRAD